jgi:alpha-L-rhamnosidase
MKTYLIFFLAFQLTGSFVQAQISVVNLLCENKTNPNCIDTKQPRFSWQIVSNRRNVMQTAYEVQVYDDISGKGKNTWSTGKVASDQSVFVTYKGEELRSGKQYYWKVRVWNNAGNVSGWSKPATWQMGLLQPNDWKAQWIIAGFKEDSINRPSPVFRKLFSTVKKIKSATVYITSHGLYEAYINGQRVGDSYLTPGWTSYNKRLQYQAYDVTPLIKQGENAVGVTLGSGWYRGYLAWANNKDVYGRDLALLLQLNISYTDGTSELMVSDGTWKSSTGGIKSAEIYHGEKFDARDDKAGWTAVGYDDKRWEAVQTKDYSKDILIATYNEAIKKHETFKPVKIFKTPKGEQLIDFGQNLVGWVQLKIKGKAGDSIKLHHAEVLDKAGNFYTENLRAAKQENTYILKGNGEETFEPHFTFQGFRYVKVEGLAGELKPENFTAVALYSDMKPAGSFTTSNALLNQLQHNIQWGQKGNFLDVPTDCPQRDERLGWTGDAQVFSRTASFNMDVHDFFAKWLKDVAADQLPNGSVPHVIPNVLGPSSAGSTGWADVSVIVPWNMYLAYGDKRILEEQYASMAAWINFMQQNSQNDLWNTGFHFGDWLFYRPADDNDGRSAVTDKYLIAQAFFAHSTQLMLNASQVLGKKEDAAKYSDLLKRLKAAFVKEYVTESGRLVSGTQTAYVLALNFDMLPQTLRQQAAERLVQNIKAYNNHLTTGFLGTPYLCHVLSRFGYTDVAYKLLMQETYPSWLYPVKMGATTIWERWDGEKPDSTFQTPGMNSFNHYAYGAIGDWMYRVIAGIDTDEQATGYKKIMIKPHAGGGLTNASADLNTYYGKITSAWKQDTGRLQLNVTIPCNTTAVVYLPTDTFNVIKESGKEVASPKEIKVIGKEAGYTLIAAGSGSYEFTLTK